MGVFAPENAQSALMMLSMMDFEGKDEIAILANGINHFIETLQNIMTNITANSRKHDEVVGGVSHSVATANASSVDISAVMEELSAIYLNVYGERPHIEPGLKEK